MIDDGLIFAGILVGGNSRRMGRPKLLLPVGEVSLLERTATVVAPHVSAVMLLGNFDGFVGGGLATVPDSPGVAGPLGGILAALRARPHARWLIVACDMPLLSAAAIEWLLAQQDESRIAILPKRADGTIEPLFSIFTQRALPLVEALVAGNVGSPWKLAGEPGVFSPTLPSDLESAWTNVNTPEEWDDFRSRIE